MGKNKSLLNSSCSESNFFTTLSQRISIMADVAKQEQPAETTPVVDQKAASEKVAENNPPQAEANKGKTEETPAKEEKAETAVVNGDAKVQEDNKKDDAPKESAPATTERLLNKK